MRRALPPLLALPVLALLGACTPPVDVEPPPDDASPEEVVAVLVDAINAGDPQDWPIGWACGEVGTGWPNGTDGGPVHTEPCRLRPNHDGKHDWAIAEDRNTVIAAAKAWRAGLVSTSNPKSAALMQAVDDLLAGQVPA